MSQLSATFIQQLSVYGYLVIFLLVFLQEVGVPSPIPNEFVLLFSGYLVFSNQLNLFFVIGSAFAGDVLGSSILFVVFYFFGKQIMDKKPKWIPITEQKLRRLRMKLSSFGQFGFLLGRLSPFIRGYVSVVSGLMNYNAKDYFLIIFTSAPLWASFYVIAGYFLGPYWAKITAVVHDIPLYIGFIPLTLFVIYIISQLLKKSFANTQI